MNLLRRAALAAGHDLTLGALLDRLAAVHGDRVLVDEAGGARRTHREAAELVARWSGAVDVAPGSRVVVAVPNGYDQLLACLAVARAGAVPVPLNDQMRPDEVEHVVADSGAERIVRDVGELEGGQPTEARYPPTDVAAIFYTSGTTGRPKGACLTDSAILGSLGPGALWPAFLHRDEAVIGLPVAHIMGFVVLAGLAVAGVPVRLQPRFDPVAVLDDIEGRRCTVFIGVPAMYRMLLEAGAADRDLRSIRVWGSGADAMPTELARTFQRMGATATLPVIGRSLGEALFVEGWGMVETGGAAIGRVALPYVGAPARALPGYKVRVDDPDETGVGELLVKGPGVLAGYHDDPEATAAVLDDGWLRTGDLVRQGRFGSLSFAGRTKDVIKCGGFSVFAAEVERALEECPGVDEAAVLAAPDRRLGEVPVAAVRGSARPDDVVAFAREHLAHYKVPRRVVLVDELPRGGTGKVQKDLLRAFFD
ncbi:MAG: Acyl-CoA synthetase (AMP-forming)/AMP-acid ligase [Actinomycetia bacterium]|nr:Acyl-CoA synthetase (AMP-forming)/AMP-acid ligase [Actinomycetes bacterium]